MTLSLRTVRTSFPQRVRGRLPRTGQRGAIAVMFSMSLIVMLGFIGVALDLGVVHNRAAELQAVANTAALAAAERLNGTAAGVANALDAADTAAARFHYQYGAVGISWTDAAVTFASAPDGPWLAAGAAQAAPAGVRFARVDTGALDEAHGRVDLAFMRLLSSAFDTITVGARAVAGRSTVGITPLAVCALSNTAIAARAHPGPPSLSELVEFGFRRGVSYDLMQLNPGGTTAENFAVDPIAPPGSLGSAANMLPATIGPFVCSGTLAMPRVTGGAITLGRPFPLASLFEHLNSRFDQYPGGLCSPNGAPPDSNVKPYPFGAIPWMTTARAAQTAQSSTADGKLRTIADPDPTPTTNTAPAYGPLWSFARAVPFASYVAGAPEPATGYTPFAASAWATLYRPGQPVPNSYPTSLSSTPYKLPAGANFLAPSAANRPGRANRRVLNVPLLSCPVGAGPLTSANVLGIGRFFMTVPATATSISAEFAGAVSDESLAGPVELFP